MLRLVKDNAIAICIWMAAIAAALIVYWISNHTQFHQLAAGLLLSSVGLFIAMSLFEAIWLAAIGLLEPKASASESKRK